LAAPLAVSVAALPEQIVAELTVTVGFEFTDTAAVLVNKQPDALVALIV
jgi:hypothetical protein